MQFHEKTGYWAVTAMRSSFDFITNYGPGKMDECKWLQRIVFLETVAGVPGMVGGMVRAPPHICVKHGIIVQAHTLLYGRIIPLCCRALPGELMSCCKRLSQPLLVHRMPCQQSLHAHRRPLTRVWLLQLRHMRSLRSMRRDNGWIHTLLEEAENERMVSRPAPA